MKQLRIPLRILPLTLLALTGCFLDTKPECHNGDCCDTGGRKVDYVTTITDAKAQLIGKDAQSISAIYLDWNTPGLPNYASTFMVCKNNLNNLQSVAKYVYPADTSISRKPHPYRVTGKIFAVRGAQPACISCYPHFLHVDKIELIND